MLSKTETTTSFEPNSEVQAFVSKNEMTSSLEPNQAIAAISKSKITNLTQALKQLFISRLLSTTSSCNQEN